MLSLFPTPKMKVRFLALFLLISGIQAISTSEFNMNFTSKGKGLIQSNGPVQELLGTRLLQPNISHIWRHPGFFQCHYYINVFQWCIGKLYGSIEDSIRLNDKVEETKDGNKEERLNTTRKAQGGGSSGGTGSRGKTGAGGTADVNRRPRQSSAPSEPLFWVSIFNPFVSLALVILFPFHLVWCNPWLPYVSLV